MKLKRDLRYFRARYWAERRALAMPGVRFTASIDRLRLSVQYQEGRLTYHQWHNFEEEEARNGASEGSYRIT